MKDWKSLMEPVQRISDDIWRERYRYGDEPDRKATMKRMSDVVCSYYGDRLEGEELENITSLVEETLTNFRFIPGGRILASLGTDRKKATLFNCFVMDTIGDSLEDILRVFKESMITMKYGGGVGMDFSTLRPKGDLVMGNSAHTEGPISFMEIWNSGCATISSYGARRGAMMGVMRVDHPDIEAFIKAKREKGRLNYFNISVGVTEEFIKAVREDKPFDLRFNGKVYKTVNARELWDSILKSNYEYAEPGVLFIDRINQNNNLKKIETIAATNPCVVGETPILTKDGWVPIRDVVGKEVDVWNGFEWSRTIPEKTGENREVCKVSLSDGSEIVCTWNHKFQLADGSRVEASELKEGDCLAVGNWPVVEGGKEYDIDAYAQGFFAGDGWVKSETGGQYIALYGDKKDIQHEWGERSRKFYEAVSGFSGEKSEERVYLFFGKDHFREKTWVPLDATVDFRRRWLSGLVDSDGCVSSSNAIQISSKDREFLYNVKLLVNTLGVRCTLSRMKEHWRLSIPGSQVPFLFLETKRVVFEDRHISPRIRNIKVVSVEPAGVADEVFCFTEKFRHLGCFNGVLTGQCGEQPLPPHGACLLGSVNLTAFVDRPFTKKARFDFSSFEKAAFASVLVLDPVIDLSSYPIEAQEEEAKNKRRMGVGITGLGSTLAMLGIRYGSDEAVAFAEKIGKALLAKTYEASAYLASLFSPFPLYEKVDYTESPYFNRLPRRVREAIMEHGLRNSHLTSIAPTGTMSLFLDNVSSGIEPIFLKEYSRKTLMPNGERVEYIVEDYAWRLYKKLKDRGEEVSDDAIVTTDDLEVEDHLVMLKAIAPYIDSAISKTINIPKDYSFDDFKKVYDVAYDYGLKGCTTYRPNDILGSVISKIEDDKKETEGDKRPEVLFGKTMKVKWKDEENYYITINERDGSPFEVFIQTNGEDQMWYSLIGRLISAILRKEKDIDFLVRDLKRTFDPSGGTFMKGKYVPSFPALLGAYLEEFVVGSGDVEGSGSMCPKCSSMTLVKEEGCSKCLSCGYSKCG